MDTLLEFLVRKAHALFIFCSVVYSLCVNDVFFNATCEKKTVSETIADNLLIPYQYALMGRVAIFREDGSWYFKQRFDYSEHFWIKNIASWIAAPLSFAIGGSVKGIAYLLQPQMQERYKKLKTPQPVHLLNDVYRQSGLFGEHSITDEPFQSQNLPRQPGDENILSEEKDALRELGEALTEAGILWWVDCGTCLGTYRYGGAIPWDFDIDIALLEPDFQNAYSILSNVNPSKYHIFDLSSRDHPMTLIKICLQRDPRKVIDVYFFRVNSLERTLSFILSQENHIFLSKSWKIRERPFKTAATFEDVFPLQRASFDGIPVFVPRRIENYLRRVYGQNLDPVKVYNPQTESYEKDLSHPYWRRPFAH